GVEELGHLPGVAAPMATAMKRYSSGLYARLGFSVAVHSNPDIVLVDEVLAVGDASFRRRAVESLRGLIADGKTVLFISHDIWSVRRLCDRIIWMDGGRVRADGPSGAVAERYLDDVNLQALAGQQSALLSHRGGTGEVRYTDVSIVGNGGASGGVVREGSPLVVRAAYEAAHRVASPVFQVAIVDVDTGVVVATATSSPGDAPEVERGGVVDCIFESLPLRRRQYALRLTITDAQHAVSYDVVSAGPRFAVGAAHGAEDDGEGGGDGVGVLPYRFELRSKN